MTPMRQRHRKRSGIRIGKICMGPMQEPESGVQP